MTTLIKTQNHEIKHLQIGIAQVLHAQTTLQIRQAGKKARRGSVLLLMDKN
jgi:hypothetical protein